MISSNYSRCTRTQSSFTLNDLNKIDMKRLSFAEYDSISSTITITVPTGDLKHKNFVNNVNHVVDIFSINWLLFCLIIFIFKLKK